MERSGRAQTTVDFAIAMGVFLVVLVTVIAFMPTITQPFTGGQENPLAADRIAAQLVDGTLGDPSTPSTMNATCTEFFFNGSATPADPCPSFEPDTNVTAKLGVGPDTFLNVTIQQDKSGGASPEILCGEGPGLKTLYEQGHSDCNPGGDNDVVLQDGPIPPNQGGSVTLARRSASLNGEVVFVVVKVWT